MFVQQLCTVRRPTCAPTILRRIKTPRAPQEVLYPVVREKLGALAAQTLLDEHQALKVLTSQLSGATIEKLGQGQFDELLKQVMLCVCPHLLFSNRRSTPCAPHSPDGPLCNVSESGRGYFAPDASFDLVLQSVSHRPPLSMVVRVGVVCDASS